jgi:uncharacterized FlaG/YvyC family protein
MDVNIVNHSEGSSQAVDSPVVPSAKPESAKPRKIPLAERAKNDTVEFSYEPKVKATESPLVANSGRNIRSSSQVFHDDGTNQFVVRVMNESNEMIRQLPPEEALRIASRFKQVTGLLFDQVI